MRKTLDLRWLLLLLAVVLVPGGVLATAVHDAGVAQAGEDDDDGGDDDDPFAGDDGDDDFFDAPTTFSKEEAEKAILKGVAYLKKVQKDDGSWGDVVGDATYSGEASQGQGEHPAGPTALALYALLKCKVPTKDPSVRKGFEYLKKRHEKPGSSYETSAMLLAMCATANPYKTSAASTKRVELLKLKGKWRGWAQKLHAHLLDKKQAQVWRYNVTGQSGSPPGGSQDLSSTQLAALALFAAHQVKIRTPDSVWQDILDYTMSAQEDDGREVVTKDPLTGAEIRRKARGFCYIKGLEDPEQGQATGSMTACGIANIMMARFILTDAGRKREEWEATVDAKKIQRAIEDGLCWLEENWNARTNPRKQRMNVYHLYWMYSVERAMDLVGHQKIGTHLWYSEMGQSLISTQADDGSWDSNSTHEPRKTLDTCFALLFLKKATQGQIPFPSVTGGTDEPPVDNR